MRKPVNRNYQKNSMGAIQRRLEGVVDPRGPVGIQSRGANVYRGTSLHAHSGGGSQYGRPRSSMQAAALRRLQRRR